MHRRHQAAAHGQLVEPGSGQFVTAGGGDQDLSAQCPNGVSSVQEQKSFVDQLISGLTGFLYSPTSVVVECAGGGATASNP